MPAATKTEAILDAVQRMPDSQIREALENLAKIDPVIWCGFYRRLRGNPLTYDYSKHVTDDAIDTLRVAHPKTFDREKKNRLLRHRPFLMQPLRDQHPHKVYIKGRQVGVSELELTECFHFLHANPSTKWIYCLPADAEILTQRGWLHYQDVRPGDEALGLDTETHVSQWTPIKCIETFDWNGALPAVGPFHCTPDHRWPVVTRNARQGTYEPRVKRTHELSQCDRLLRMAPHASDGTSILSPRLAAILGWVVTDGHQRGSSMRVYQSRHKHLDKIEMLLRAKRKPTNRKLTAAKTLKRGVRGGRIVGYTSTGHAIYGDQYLVSVSRDDVQKLMTVGYGGKDDLPGIVTQLSPEAAEAMLQAMLQADGCKSGPKLRSTFFAKLDPRVRDAFQILCALTGRAANLTERGAYVIEPETKMARIKPCAYSTKPRRYTGKVWCPQTGTGTFLMRYRGKVVFSHNTFPRDTQLRTFSTTRMTEALNESPRLRRIIGVPNGLYLKKIGDSYLILRSAWESNLGEGVDADGVTLDEKDRMKEGVDIAFRESLSSSKYGFLREVSTPTLPGRGVDIPYSMSDQNVWLVRCTRCNLEQEVLFPDNIVAQLDIPVGTKELPEGAYEYVCRKEKCRGLLDRMRGRWVPKHPSRKHIRGYHIPQTIAPWISATEVMQKKIDIKFYQLWANYVLGMVAKGENVLVTDRDFDMACASFEPIYRRTQDWEQICIGIDWGHLNWCVVMATNVHNQRQYVINVGVFEDNYSEPLHSVKAIDSFIAPFAPELIIADAGYGKDRNAYLLKKYGPGRFYACGYNPSNKHSRTFTPVWSSEDEARVLVDRTITLKVTCRSIKEREFGLFSPAQPMMQQLIQHFKNLSPLIIEEDGELYEDISCSGPDHLVHATGYAWLAHEHLTKNGRFTVDFL